MAPGAAPVLRITNEVSWLKRVLVCSPGEELRRVPPEQRERYLVEDVLWLERAQEQHAAFVRALEALMRAGGAESPEVVDLRVALGRALADETARDATDALIEEVCRLEPALRPADVPEEVARLRQRVRALGGRLGDELIAGVLVDRPDPGRELFRVCPSPNVVFARDYQFVLGGGAFFSAMAKPVRAKEPTLARFVFERALGLGAACVDLTSLGTSRRLEGVDGQLSIEGGDVMALSATTVVVGISERTTRRGASALAMRLRAARLSHPEAFPFTELCAVELPARRAMMHLDTVFSLVDHGLALAYPPLTFPGAREEMPVYACSLDCEPDAPIEWRWVGPFSTAIAPRAVGGGEALTLIAGGGPVRRFQHREQWCDACNALAVGPGVAISYDRNDRTLAALKVLDNPKHVDVWSVTIGRSRRGGDHLRPFRVVPAHELTVNGARALVQAGERVMVCIEGGELGRARGGPHCMSMALSRRTAVGGPFPPAVPIASPSSSMRRT